MSAGRGWAASGFILGAAVSIAANVAHTYHLPGGGVPPIGAQLAAAFYPLALVVVIEVLSRVQWPRSRSWLTVRVVGAGAVAVVAAVVSYSHMHGLLLAYGETAVTAAIGPVAVDGLMITCGLALLATGSRGGREQGKGVNDSFAPDEASALATYLASALPPDDGEGPAGLLPPAEGRPIGYGLWAGIDDDASAWDGGPGPVPSTESTGDHPVATGHPADATTGPVVATGDPLVATARDRFARVLATGNVPSVRAVRTELRVGHPRARRIRDALATDLPAGGRAEVIA